MAGSGSGEAQIGLAEAQLCSSSHRDAASSFLAKAFGRARAPWGGEGASVASSVKETSPAPLTRMDHTLERDAPLIIQSCPEQGALQCGLHKDGAGTGAPPGPPGPLPLPGPLPCLPDAAQSRPLFSFILGSSPSEALGQREQGLAASLGSRTVLNPEFGIVWWHWGTAPRSRREGQMWECQHEVGAFKGEQVTPKLVVNAKIHGKWLLGSFRRKALWTGGGPGCRGVMAQVRVLGVAGSRTALPGCRGLWIRRPTCCQQPLSDSPSADVFLWPPEKVWPGTWTLYDLQSFLQPSL